MDKIKSFLSGKKTHVAGAGLILVGVGVLTGFLDLDQKQLEAVMAILLGAGKIALRLAQSKLGVDPEKLLAQVAP